MLKPSLDEAKEMLESEYNQIPFSLELYSDFTTTIEVLKKIKKLNYQCFLLESGDVIKGASRFTIIGYDPMMHISTIDNKTEIKTKATTSISMTPPSEIIRKLLRGNKSPKIKNLPDFTGGFAGYFAYDYIKYTMPELKIKSDDKEEFKDLDLMFFDKVIVFDNYLNKIILIVNIDVKNIKEIDKAYKEAEQKLDIMKKLISDNKIKYEQQGKILSRPKQLFTLEEYCKMVEKAKEYIREGDIFQVVISNQIEVKYQGDLIEPYRALRTINPSTYTFYFQSDDLEMIGASPETLVKLTAGKVLTYPLAGTRARNEDPELDKYQEENLKSDEKECAEHNMLVDLGRNDIGKISKFGSVIVEKYMNIQKCSHVMHLSSTVSGRLSQDKDAIDCIESILPAGTLSGAPKLRACQIIDELENTKRGVYGGAIGYISLNGETDTCIAIRLAYKKNNKVFVRSGAGIVADSIAENEYQECIDKSKAIMIALEKGQGGEKNDIAG